MKLTVVCDLTGAEDNGAAVAALSLIRAMKQRGHEVVAVCTDETKRGWEGYVVLSRSGGTKYKNGETVNISDKEALENAVWDSDVVHIMTTSETGFAAAKLCRQVIENLHDSGARRALFQPFGHLHPSAR